MIKRRITQANKSTASNKKNTPCPEPAEGPQHPNAQRSSPERKSGLLRFLHPRARNASAPRSTHIPIVIGTPIRPNTLTAVQEHPAQNQTHLHRLPFAQPAHR